jgi:hypothetical protein
MKKFILGTHQGKPLTPSVISFLERKNYRIIQTKFWAEAIKMCGNVTFNIIIGHCNYDQREISRYLKNINSAYTQNGKSAASILLHATKEGIDLKHFAGINGYIKATIPFSADEATIISLIENIEKLS